MDARTIPLVVVLILSGCHDRPTLLDGTHVRPLEVSARVRRGGIDVDGRLGPRAEAGPGIPVSLTAEL